ncbi:MAG TPA: hypothetical protein VI894_03315 [Candidatus Nanoarchaeia archaeon]|nr:hypothetical protein [Candidatus Nanoarchaeia archaeon]
MNYEIIWHPKAAKYLESLQPKLAKRILDKFDALAEEPFRYLDA